MNYVLNDGRLDWKLDGIAHSFSKEVTGITTYYDPERISIEKGAKAVLKHVLKRLRWNEPIPAKPTKTQANYGISEAMVVELTKRLFVEIHVHVTAVEAAIAEAREVSDGYTQTV